MGIISDYLEENREKAVFDPCLVIPQKDGLYSGHFLNWLLKRRTCVAENKNEMYLSQIKQVQDINNAESRYTFELYLIETCFIREKQVLAVLRGHEFLTYVVRETIEEYLNLVRGSAYQAVIRLEQVKKQQKREPEFSRLSKREDDTTPISLILHSLFFYLTSKADFDDSRFLQAIFIDISKLIKLVKSVPEGQRPKEICKDYYEEVFGPSYGIDRCYNCGEKLYKGCPYCFNCFERMDIK